MNEYSENIIKLSPKQGQKTGKKHLSNSAGYYYMITEKDLNGNPYSKSTLLQYASNCKYIIRVMREVDNKVILCDYQVEYNKIFDFIEKVTSGQINGTIIEIEKYLPKDLA